MLSNNTKHVYYNKMLNYNRGIGTDYGSHRLTTASESSHSVF